MIRQAAFIDCKRHLKGGLHCHTTRSDGEATPEETIAIHEQKGYDFLAITDHRIYNFKNFLPGSKLTIIPGMEFDAHIAPQRRISSGRKYTATRSPLRSDLSTLRI